MNNTASETSKAVIRLTGVSKHFRRQQALRDVTLEVPSGAVFALLGENGAGKTTAIRILLGLIDADSGDVEVLGHKSSRDGLEIRRAVGYMPDIGWMIQASSTSSLTTT